MTDAQTNDIALSIKQLGISQMDALRLIRKETDYPLSQSTLSRVIKGEAKPAMIAFVRYALINIINKQKSEK